MLAGKTIGGMKGNYAKVTNVTKNGSECNNSSNIDSMSISLPNNEKSSTKDVPNKTKKSKRKAVKSNNVLSYPRASKVRFVTCQICFRLYF